MCIIVYKPKGKTPKKEVYETCFNNNKDGAGFIVREKSGELKIEKGFFTFQDFWEKFKPHQSKQAIIHFRIATHGEKDTENCHPFWVKENTLAFAHNGVMNDVDCSKDATRSDTWHFNVAMMQHLQEKMGEEFIFDEVLQTLISGYIGWSKLAFMHQDGRVLIFNKKSGEYVDGVWFSNTSYKSYKQPKRQKNKFWNVATEVGYAAYEQHVNFCGYIPPVVPNPVVPVPIRLNPPMSSTLRGGDYIEMIQPYRDLTGRELGLVVSVYGDRTAEIKIYDCRAPTGWKIRNLPYEVFRVYSVSSDKNRDYEKESMFLGLTKPPIEGEVLPTTVAKLEERPAQTLEQSGVSGFWEEYKENYLN